MIVHKDIIERLSGILGNISFQFACKSKFGYTLETIDEVYDLISNGLIEYEDVFNEHIELVFKDYLDDTEQKFFDDNWKLFNVEVFHPEHKKLPEGGAWIKLFNETGFELHYAKFSTRKRRYNEEISKIQKEVLRRMNKRIEQIKNSDLDEKTELEKIHSEDKKIKELNFKLSYLTIIQAIDIPIYEIRYQRTKTQVGYATPCDYEIIDGETLQTYIDAVINKVPGIKMKNLYTSVSKDQIFYLRSRGLSKEQAEILSNLKQCYFKCDITEMTNVYNDYLQSVIKIKTKEYHIN